MEKERIDQLLQNELSFYFKWLNIIIPANVGAIITMSTVFASSSDSGFLKVIGGLSFVLFVALTIPMTRFIVRINTLFRIFQKRNGDLYRNS